MVQSHCKIKGSSALPPIGGFITNIAPPRKVRARPSALSRLCLLPLAHPFFAFSFSNSANGLGRLTGASAGAARHSAGTAASALRG
jgi:hypothetical protein